MSKKPIWYKSLKYAVNGVWWVLKKERNFQIEVFFVFINLLLMFFFDVSRLDAVAIVFCCALVLSAELMNTAVEKLCDFVHPQYHASIGLVKDIAAAAVLCAAMMSIVVGIIVYFPYIKQYF
ncbi:MAG: diacylglycerol kinase family protein [Bacteroidetes bacterium]|nr:diacylglycerol kinase family protein [Bacteroidota bacterium]